MTESIVDAVKKKNYCVNQHAKMTPIGRKTASNVNPGN